MKRRGQISIEYLIVVGFVTLLVISLLGVSYFYASSIRDQIRTNQAKEFAEKVIVESEKIYYAGEPSKTTITAYLPAEVTALWVEEQSIIISIRLSSGLTTTSYTSNVPLELTVSTDPGVKKLSLVAQPERVLITEA